MPSMTFCNYRFMGYLAIPPCIAEIAFMAIEVQSASALCLMGLILQQPHIGNQ